MVKNDSAVVVCKCCCKVPCIPASGYLPCVHAPPVGTLCPLPPPGCAATASIQTSMPSRDCSLHHAPAECNLFMRQHTMPSATTRCAATYTENTDTVSTWGQWRRYSVSMFNGEVCSDLSIKAHPSCPDPWLAPSTPLPTDKHNVLQVPSANQAYKLEACAQQTAPTTQQTHALGLHMQRSFAA
jgi:hypothetical protein